ncbi:MAG: DUF434 domain-containing protein [Planctomycetes bacterium]|nr:DUF434 domain-containing protein [Planctomycetota bacterium]
MPDKRQHRGRHPADAEAFSPEVQPTLRQAVADLSWLLSHGYADKSAVKLVGDRYNLVERQRIAVARCACSDAALARRTEHRVDASAVAHRPLLLDGYNVLTTIEAALAGGIVLAGRDGCYRDMASMHGTFRQVRETLPALALVGEFLAARRVGEAVWLLDRPVSNSGRLKLKLIAVAAERTWPWRVELVGDPDAVLAATPDIVATADSMILDRCARWFNLAREIVIQHVPRAPIVDL